MNDSFTMGGVERIGDLDRQRHQDLGIQRLPRDAVLQGHAVEEFHHDKRLAVLLIDLVNGADIRMIQGRGGFGLALETAERLGILGYVVRQELEGYETAKLDVLGL